MLLLGQGGFDKKEIASALMRASARPRSLVVVGPNDLEALNRHEGLDAGGVAFLEGAENLIVEEIAHWFQSLKALDVQLVADAAKHNEVIESLGRHLAESLVMIEIPKLAEIREDIPLIIEGLLETYLDADPSCDVPHFSAQALKVLMTHDWPGNLDELRDVIARATKAYPGQLLAEAEVRQLLNQAAASEKAKPRAARVPASLPAISAFENTMTPESSISLKDYLGEIERTLVTDALEVHGQNVSRAARALGLQRTTLIEKMKKMGLR